MDILGEENIEHKGDLLLVICSGLVLLGLGLNGLWGTRRLCHAAGSDGDDVWNRGRRGIEIRKRHAR
jgi:hypothetical protein